MQEKKEDIGGDKKEKREDNAKDETKKEDLEKAKKSIHTSRFRA